MKRSNKYNFGILGNIIILISIFLIFFSLFSPYLFTQSSIFGINFSHTGNIGDTIGGIMGPIIAIAGVLLTFLAFYIQFEANKQQRELFRKELDSNIFENQFYEMLKLHKENVNDIYVEIDESTNSDEKIKRIYGRESFKYLIEELTIIYFVMKKINTDYQIRKILNQAYSIFFHGLHYARENLIIDNKDSIIDILESIKYEIDPKTLISNNSLYENPKGYSNKMFNGHSDVLAHYYRHLFHTVKFIVDKPDDFISYSEKRKYLRLLRTQLTNQEQTLLLYNWLSEYGKNWENEKNHFLTDYRMIHNIYNELLIPDFKLEELFNPDIKYKKDKNRDNDDLFEFMDWK